MSETEFHFPTLIYDNYCSSCSKFAMAIYHISRKRIEIMGHYDTERSTRLKNSVFKNYHKDPTRMFWYVKEDRAYASRSGLLQILRDLPKMILGISKYSQATLVDQKCSKACYIGNNFYSQYGCGDDPRSISKRIKYLLKNSDSLRWSLQE
ncbi:hypothetical protein [Candidatus Nitrosocosmicus franklandus]|uniref:DUF393 domain-containing protein n=1 Tax=Candidatus Nitrosocosmicus franklandianus TaxID=1798806 RepID=A0A484IC72_9ARCH|nr:hypothetical protein [Candidatus Nitrosocosmicus franklandus]VFJ14690.1 conserved protein of unknown function [Candidatus Nitrosocosmicus franklandus]